MNQNELAYFRPKARHIFTIGKDLIKDDFSALIELIKNSYDADAIEVNLEFIELKNGIEIKISDIGTGKQGDDIGLGMSEEDIRTKWLIPSTDNKILLNKSPKGRILQGQKGIGRYAVSVLGYKMLLKTVKNGIKTIVSINWDDFNTDKFLDEIYIDIKTEKTNENNNTVISAFGDLEKLELWKNQNKQNQFELELDKLKPPFDIEDNFSIKLNFFGKDIPINNEQYLDYFDYKVEGSIDNNGIAIFLYLNNYTKKVENIEIDLKLNNKNDELILKYPGKIEFKLLVLDLDPIDKRNDISRQFDRIITNRGDQKRYYEKYAGVSIYRGGFRIRPYGEKHEDWLGLNMRRVNNPTLRLSTNQLLGYIKIENEKDSHLVEASSREKLIENEYFHGLVYELKQVISEIELRRFKYRKQTGDKEAGKTEFNIEEKINELENEIQNINSDEDKQRVIDKTKKLGEGFNKEKARLEQIITQYEGQVTLGKLLAITFHETSKPTKFMKENIKNVQFYIKEIETRLIGGLGELGFNILELLRGYEINAKIVSEFMSKNLKPLVKGRGSPTFFKLNRVFTYAHSTFASELLKNNINIEIKSDKNIEIYGYERDFLVAFTNFFDNSIYWLNQSNSENKVIFIETREQSNNLEIYIKDNGFGLLNINELDDILEPGFSRKPDGTGLGLSIAGEVLNDNNVKLNVLGADEEYNFILKLIITEWKK